VFHCIWPLKKFFIWSCLGNGVVCLFNEYFDKLVCFSETIAALKKLESEPYYNDNLIKASAKWQNDPSGVCFSRKIMHVLMCIVIRHACWRHMQTSDTWNGCRQWKLRNDSVYVASQTGNTVQSSVGRSRHQRAQTRGGRWSSVGGRWGLYRQNQWWNRLVLYACFFFLLCLICVHVFSSSLFKMCAGFLVFFLMKF